MQLLELAEPHGHRLPIDIFFRSLAQSKQELAIGIVLSGTGSDGALGVREIKAEGDMVMAQTPESSEYDGMPRSAIATGMVDYNPDAGRGANPARCLCHPGLWKKSHLVLKAEDAMKHIFNLLRVQTGLSYLSEFR